MPWPRCGQRYPDRSLCGINGCVSGIRLPFLRDRLTAPSTERPWPPCVQLAAQPDRVGNVACARCAWRYTLADIRPKRTHNVAEYLRRCGSPAYGAGPAQISLS
jgi:hypothetical protein